MFAASSKVITAHKYCQLQYSHMYRAYMWTVVYMYNHFVLNA